MGFAGAPRRHDRHFKVANRLVAAGDRRRQADAGQDAGDLPGERRFAEFQCLEPDARAWPLDADGDHPKPILSAKSLH